MTEEEVCQQEQDIQFLCAVSDVVELLRFFRRQKPLVTYNPLYVELKMAFYLLLKQLDRESTRRFVYLPLLQEAKEVFQFLEKN